MISRIGVSSCWVLGMCLAVSFGPSSRVEAAPQFDCNGTIEERSQSVVLGGSILPWDQIAIFTKAELAPGESLIAVSVNTYFMADTSWVLQNLSLREACEAVVMTDLLFGVQFPDNGAGFLEQYSSSEGAILPPGGIAKSQNGGIGLFNSQLYLDDFPGFDGFIAGSPGEPLIMEPQANAFLSVDSTCGTLAVNWQTIGFMEVELRYTVCVEPVECPSADALELWPPNHQYHALDLNTILQGPGDDYAYTITAITQDEPIDGTGDGNTTCDGTGVGSDVAMLRAERKGDGDGRVYHVSFSATTPDGETCTGVLIVSVPHSQNGDPAIDSGQAYDSGEGCGN